MIRLYLVYHVCRFLFVCPPLRAFVIPNRCQAEYCAEHACSGTAEARRRKTRLTETYGRV